MQKTFRVNLTTSEEMHKFIKSEADKLGITIAEYLRHLIIKEKELKDELNSR
jgi:hypothetical protein